MASGSYESVRAIRVRAARTVRAAIATERRRSALRVAPVEATVPRIHPRERRAPTSLRWRPSAFLRGVMASVLVASGYVAVMAGAHWLLGGLLR